MTAYRSIHRHALALRLVCLLCAAPVAIAPASQAQALTAPTAATTPRQADLQSAMDIAAIAQANSRPVAGNLAKLADEMTPPAKAPRPSLFSVLVSHFAIPLLALSVLGLLGRLFARRRA